MYRINQEPPPLVDRGVDALDVHPDVIRRLRAAGFRNCEHVAHASLQDLLERGFNDFEAYAIRRAAAELQQPQTNGAA